MSIDVTFLGQTYSFGDDLKEYVDSLRLSEKITDNLVNSFISLSKRQGGIIDAKEIRPNLINKSDKFIKKLCNKGVFSKSAEDYVDENDGYKAIQEICADGVSVYSNILIDEINEFQDGMNNAYADAASNITGTGVRVYTSSLATLALNSAYEYSVLKGQAKKADAQYKKAINELSDRTEAKSDKRKNEYLKNTYYPSMTDAITLFSFSLVQKYISDLISECKFDDSVLENAQIKKSNTLLDNLKHISDQNNRIECIKQAFEACPFNERVYETVIEIDAFDSDSYNASKLLGMDEAIAGYIKPKIAFAETADLDKMIKRKAKYINAFSICSGLAVTDVLKNATSSIYNSVVLGYKSVIGAISNSYTLFKQTYYLSDDKLLELQDADIKEKVIEAVNGIASEKTFDALINTCGYNSLLNELSDVCGDGTFYANKTDLDIAFVDKIYKKLKSEIESKKLSIAAKRKIEEENKLIEKEAALVKAKKTRNGIIAVLLVMAAIITGTIIFTVIIPNQKYDNALHLIDIGEYENAINAFIDLNGYRDSSDKIIEAKYLYADNMVASGNYYGAKEIYEIISDYKDSSDQISYCDYNIAMSLMNDNKYDEAMLAFDKISGYSDSVDQIKECKYRQASDFIDNNEYDNAIELLTGIKSYKDSQGLLYKCKYRKASVLMKNGNYDDAINLLNSINNYYECSSDIMECKYAKAISMIDIHKYYEAYTILNEIYEYKDSLAIINNIYENHPGELWVGETITYGKYDGNDICWTAIKTEKDRTLVLCNNCLISTEYSNTGFKYATWSSSPIRKWLNNEFLTSFSAEELNNILETNVENPGNTQYNNVGEGFTKDKLFLLSITEAKSLLSSNNGKATYNGLDMEWWLRTSGKNNEYAAIVTKTGSVYSQGEKVNEKRGVRPVMWIKVE